MAGTYGWNIESTQELIESEGEYVKMPMPFGTEEETRPAIPSQNPCVKGCCGCCGTDDQPEFNGPGDVRPPGNLIVNEKGYYWCTTPREIPEEAVKAGLDKDGGDIFVGRAIHDGELQPAKIVPNHGCAYIAVNGEEISKDEYEVLCRGPCNVVWQECQDGYIPPSAVAVGRTADNERLYIGRVFHDGTHTPGKIQPSHGACYIPYGGEELSFPNYEVLILI